MQDHSDKQTADEIAAGQEPQDHTLRLLHRYHGPGHLAATTGDDGQQEYHLPHLVVDVTKHMVSAAVARDPLELEKYEAKAEDAIAYLRHERPWHLHHKEWFVIIMLGIVQHATVAMFGDEKEEDALIAVATAEYLSLTQADPLDGPHEREAKVQAWMRELWRDAWVGDDPSYARIPENARLTVSACLAAQALTRYRPKDFATWDQWWDVLLPQEEEELGHKPGS
jgi:hypothetical protein